MKLSKRRPDLFLLFLLFVDSAIASSICGTNINCKNFFIRNPQATTVITNFVDISQNEITSGNLGAMLSGLPDGDSRIREGTLIILPSEASSAFLEQTFDINRKNMAVFLPESTSDHTLTFKPADDADISRFSIVGDGTRALITLSDAVENVFLDGISIDTLTGAGSVPIDFTLATRGPNGIGNLFLKNAQLSGDQNNVRIQIRPAYRNLADTLDITSSGTRTVVEGRLINHFKQIGLGSAILDFGSRESINYDAIEGLVAPVNPKIVFSNVTSDCSGNTKVLNDSGGCIAIVCIDCIGTEAVELDRLNINMPALQLSGPDERMAGAVGLTLLEISNFKLDNIIATPNENSASPILFFWPKRLVNAPPLAPINGCLSSINTGTKGAFFDSRISHPDDSKIETYDVQPEPEYKSVKDFVQNRFTPCITPQKSNSESLITQVNTIEATTTTQENQPEPTASSELPPVNPTFSETFATSSLSGSESVLAMPDATQSDMFLHTETIEATPLPALAPTPDVSHPKSTPLPSGSDSLTSVSSTVLPTSSSTASTPGVSHTQYAPHPSTVISSIAPSTVAVAANKSMTTSASLSSSENTPTTFYLRGTPVTYTTPPSATSTDRVTSSALPPFATPELPRLPNNNNPPGVVDCLGEPLCWGGLSLLAAAAFIATPVCTGIYCKLYRHGR